MSADTSVEPVTLLKSAIARRRTDISLVLLDFVVAVVLSALWSGQIWTALLEAVIVVLFLELAGGYNHRITLSALDDLPRLAGTVFISVVTGLVIFDREASTLVAILIAAVLAVALFVVRLAYYWALRHRRRSHPASRSRTAVLGGGLVAAELVESIARQPELGMEPVVVIDQDPMFDTDKFRIPVIADVPVNVLVEREQISTLIVAFRNQPDSSLVSMLRACGEMECEIYIVPRLFEFVHLTPDMDRIHTIPVIRVRRNVQHRFYWRFKRLLDLTLTVPALLLLSPLLAATAVAIYFTDRSAPIIFRQTRVGRHGKEFTLFKFRSMRPVAATTSDVDWKPDQVDRVGRLGRFLRQTSIDELPQLWNVARGDMSLVGPRPERPHFVEQFSGSVQSYQDRHRVTVGLTGWAAINGLRGDTDIRDRALYDNFYIENWSVWLDVKIIILTVRAVLHRTGS